MKTSESISIYNRKTRINITIDDIIKYHGGLCPGIAMGFKATKLAINELCEEVPRRDDFLIIISNTLPKCAVDALEFIFRAKTRGNLIIKNTGKKDIDWKLTYVGKSSKWGIIIKLKQNSPEEMLPKLEREEFTKYIMSSDINELFDYEIVTDKYKINKLKSNNKSNNIMMGVYKFHNHESPGTTIGTIMTDYAIELMNKLYNLNITNNKIHKYIYVIVETDVCLPDAAQVITKCTIGNSKMKVMDYNKFAMTLYYWDWDDLANKHRGFGIRIYIDTSNEKQKKYKKFYDWFLKRKTKEKLPKNILFDEIIRANRDLLKYDKVYVKCLRNVKFNIMYCKICGEPCPENDIGICGGCKGEKYYTLIE